MVLQNNIKRIPKEKFTPPGKEPWTRVDDVWKVVVLPTSGLLPDPAAEFEHCEPENDGDDEQGGDDEEDEDLEPDVEEEDDGVDEQAQGEEDVDEVEAEPRQEQVVASDQLDGRERILYPWRCLCF